jgi:tetratricopeptide (TPR) repeat protein
MADSDSPDISETRAEKIRRIVESDYERITGTDDPWQMLDVSRGDKSETINDKFERYEQFYRVENFKRFDDKDLTRKALEIRKKISRAVVEVQAARQNNRSSLGFVGGSQVSQSIDPDSVALADIFFRDGITWMKLEDLDSAIDCFQRSIDHNPSNGLTLAYHAFARFKRHRDDSEVVEECRDAFKTAAVIEPNNAEVHVLKTRFALRTHNAELARRGIETVRNLEPGHSAIGELRRLYDELTI